MNNYALVIDISSDVEIQRHSTLIKTLPLNMVGGLDLRDSFVEVWRGSEAERYSSVTSVTTFESLVFQDRTLQGRKTSKRLRS